MEWAGTVECRAAALDDSAPKWTRTGRGDVHATRAALLVQPRDRAHPRLERGAADTFSGIRPSGNSPGLTFEGGTNYIWELAANTSTDTGGIAGDDFSLIFLSGGPLAIDEARLVVELGELVDPRDPFWSVPRLWKILDVVDPAQNPGSYFRTVVSRQQPDLKAETFVWTDASAPDLLGDVILRIHAIPEPSTVVLLTIGLSALAVAGARTRRAS